MSLPRTRRAALRAGAAVVGALCVPALALAAAPAVERDAELFGLLDRWHDLGAGMAVAVVAFDATARAAAAARPPRPAELWSGFGDSCFALGSGATGWEEDADGLGRCFFRPGEVAKLRAAGPVKRWAVAQSDEEKPRREPDPEGEARRLEIIAAYDRWAAERRSVEDATGYTAAIEASDAGVEALNAVEVEVKLCPARTLAGLARKAAWVADRLASDVVDDDLAEVFARQVAAFGGVAV